MSLPELNVEEFNDFVNSPGFKIVDFWADWCGPCKALAPVLNNLTEKFDSIKVAKFDVMQDPSVSAKYKVSSIPCVILFGPNGNEVSRQVGFKGKDALEELFLRVK